MNALKVILGCIMMYFFVRIVRILIVQHRIKKYFYMAYDSLLAYQFFELSVNGDNNDLPIKVIIDEGDVNGILFLVEETIEY